MNNQVYGNMFKAPGESFKEGLDIGIEAAGTIDRNLSFVEIQNVYDLHRTTAALWSKTSIDDFERGQNRVLYEFLKRHNPKNTLEFMKKYNLRCDNSIDYVSELLLVNARQVSAMYNSKIVWKRRIIKSLLKVNKDLLKKQIDVIKIIVRSEEELQQEDLAC